MKGDLKICSKCHKAKDPSLDFYMCAGRWRSECKQCTIKRNIKYQKKTKAWKHRYGNDEDRKQYMREYYNRNKEKFAQYRSDFRDKHPEYYKEYFRTRKEKR
jgi:hypothetical protein